MEPTTVPDLDASALLRDARRALRLRDYATALPLLSRYCDDRPGDSRALFLLGTTLAALGRTDEAKEQLKQVVRLEPTHASAWFNLARIYGQAGRRHRMRQCLRRALRADPGHVKARRAAVHYGITVPGLDLEAAIAAETEEAESLITPEPEPAPEFEIDLAEPPAEAAEAFAADQLEDEAEGHGLERWQCTTLSAWPAVDLGWRYGLLVGIAAGLVGCGLALADYGPATALLVAVVSIVAGAVAGTLTGLLGSAGANLATLVSRGVIVDVRRDVRWCEILRLEAGPWAWTVAVAAALALVVAALALGAVRAALPDEVAVRLGDSLRAAGTLPGGYAGLTFGGLAAVLLSQAVVALCYSGLAGWLGGVTVQVHPRGERYRLSRFQIATSARTATVLSWLVCAPAAVVLAFTLRLEPGQAMLAAAAGWLVGAPLATLALMSLYNALCNHIRGLEVRVTQQHRPGRLMLHGAMGEGRWK